METRLTFIFNDTTDSNVREELNLINSRHAMDAALFEIANCVFRPARKHGYGNQELNDLLISAGSTDDGESVGNMIINILEEEFYNILLKYEININR